MTSIIDILGEFLSKELDIKLMQAKGLIRLSTRDIFPNIGIDELDLNDIIELIKKGIKGRLERINASGIEKITTKMVQYIIKKQSLLTMLKM